jgi:Ran GTPase-activating protein (RanGAP) involved in mRNA processing and transport
VRALSVVIRANKGLGVLSLHLAREGHTTLKGQAKVSQELCQSLQFNKRLLTLDLSGTNLGAAEGAVLADLINYNTSLLNLNLSRTGLGAAGGHIAAMIQLNTSLINIDISCNDFGDGGGRGIAHALCQSNTRSNMHLM